MNQYITEAKYIRKTLHSIPEPSMSEVQTRKFLIDYLTYNTSLKIIDRGNWFYAKYTADPTHNTICFRADYDAVTDGDGISRHLCGHDGHAAALAAFASWISDHEPAMNIILLFQPGEESGKGALVCRQLFTLEKVDEIYSFHNIPGYPEGNLLLREGTFACASTGLEIQFQGATAHAASPENGRNPAVAVSQLVLLVDRYIREPHRGMILSTVIGIDLGSSSYGVSASEGTLRLTVRAEYEDEFVTFLDYIREQIQLLSESHGLSVAMREIERFPSTENHLLIGKLEAIAKDQGVDFQYLSDPFRWSEDFGWYLQEVSGVLFGIGAGEEHPPLHDAMYTFNDEIFDSILKMYTGICCCFSI